ncbi:DoxX family protein [Cellulomonas cellasea]|uniref:DoxX family protein n=1 Tax=Cellulomonas cellasea TaxID=43670 RepID=UPI0025A3B2D2|nr:DoxX family protein [Cellulomonas cellasea]MDM8083837.1 DoxX family protein [Cellulomonas cellasea]
MLLRKVARPMFATWFVSEGLDAVRHPSAHTAVAAGALASAIGRVPRGALGGSLDALREPSHRQITTLVQAHGVATAVAGVALAAGKAPRTAALVLAGLTAPLVVANLPDKKREPVSADERRERRRRLIRSLAFTGGALLVGIDHEGRPGIAWRVGQARERRVAAAADVAGSAKEHAAAAVRTVTTTAKDAARSLPH